MLPEQAQSLLAQAALRFGFVADSAKRLQGNSEDLVYEVIAGGQPRIARFMKADGDGSLAIRQAQMDYQQELACVSRPGVRFSSAMPSTTGNLVEAISSPHADWHAVLFEKLPGRVVRNADLSYNLNLDGDCHLTKRFYHALGSATGRMHQGAKRYPVWKDAPSSPPGWSSFRSTAAQISSNDN